MECGCQDWKRRVWSGLGLLRVHASTGSFIKSHLGYRNRSSNEEGSQTEPWTASQKDSWDKQTNKRVVSWSAIQPAVAIPRKPEEVNGLSPAPQMKVVTLHRQPNKVQSSSSFIPSSHKHVAPFYFQVFDLWFFIPLQMYLWIVFLLSFSDIF